MPIKNIIPTSFIIMFPIIPIPNQNEQQENEDI